MDHFTPIGCKPRVLVQVYHVVAMVVLLVAWHWPDNSRDHREALSGLWRLEAQLGCLDQFLTFFAGAYESQYLISKC